MNGERKSVKVSRRRPLSASRLIHRLIQFTASVLPVVPVFGAIDDLDHERVDMVGLFGDLTAQLLGNVSHDR